MPGIVGFFSRMPREAAEEQLSRMVQAIRHEQFYETGRFSDDASGLYCAWTSLPGDPQMPHRDADGRAALILSGEIYSENRQADLAEFRSSSQFPFRLNGTFHGLSVDPEKGEAALFNDRYGMHRIYVHQAKDAFYFAAEAKAILAVRPELKTPDHKSLGEFVSFSCILEDRTMFPGIQALPAGSRWTFRHGQLEQKSTYFSPAEWEGQESLPFNAYYDSLRSALTKNLPLYYSGERRVGMALTGGLDTRVLMACHHSKPGSVPTYTFGSPYRENQDVRVARRVARLKGQSHQVFEAGDEFLSRFDHYAQRTVEITEGTVDVYRASDLYMSQKARQIAPVKLVGTYGSEILRQAVMFKPKAPAEGLFRPELLRHVDEARETYMRVREQHPVTFAAFRQSPWYHHGILALERTQLTVRSPFLDNDFIRAVYTGPTGGDDVRLMLIRDGDAQLAAIPTDRGIGGAQPKLLAALSRAYQEFTFKAEYAYDYGMPQTVVKVDTALSALHLERLFLGRHKLLHFRVWYRDKLSKYVQQVLLDPRALSRPYVDRAVVESTVAAHLSGKRNHTTEIHKLLTLELLHRSFFDGR